MADPKPDKKKPATGSTPKKSKGRWSPLRLGLWFLALLCLYVLSFVGVAWGIHQLQPGSSIRQGVSATARVVYWPISWLRGTVPAVKDCLDWGLDKLESRN